MTNAERARKLQEAWCLVLAIQADLDNTGAPCAVCTTLRFHNWPEHTLHVKLQGISEKLDGLIKSLLV